MNSLLISCVGIHQPSIHITALRVRIVLKRKEDFWISSYVGLHPTQIWDSGLHASSDVNRTRHSWYTILVGVPDYSAIAHRDYSGEANDSSPNNHVRWWCTYSATSCWAYPSKADDFNQIISNRWCFTTPHTSVKIILAEPRISTRAFKVDKCFLALCTLTSRLSQQIRRLQTSHLRLMALYTSYSCGAVHLPSCTWNDLILRKSRIFLFQNRWSKKVHLKAMHGVTLQLCVATMLFRIHASRLLFSTTLKEHYTAPSALIATTRQNNQPTHC